MFASVIKRFYPRVNLQNSSFLLIMSGALYGTLAYFGTRLLQQGFSFYCMLAWRYLFAALWMLLLVQMNSSASEPSVDKKQKLSFLHILLSIMSYGMGSLLLFYSMQEIGTGLGMVIFYAYPVAVAAGLLFTGEKNLSFIVVSSLSVLLFGMYLLEGNNIHHINMLGIMFGLLSGLSYAMYVFMNRHTSHRVDPRHFTLTMCFGNAILFFLIAMMTHSLQMPQTVEAWFDILGIAILGTALPIYLMVLGLKSASAIKASILSVFEPLVTVIIGIIFLHESISLVQYAGVVLILVGAIIIQFE